MLPPTIKGKGKGKINGWAEKGDVKGKDVSLTARVK
jgi:hypothetical protein